MEPNPIILKLLQLLHLGHFVVRIERPNPITFQDDNTRIRQIVFRFKDDDYETLEVSGQDFDEVWRHAGAYLRAAGWPCED